MRRVVLFAKRPFRGAVKTRLAPLLGEEATLELYRAFLADQIAFLASFGPDCDTELCLDGPPDPDDPIGALELAVGQQGPGDLGARLERTFERSWRRGAGATVVIGADSPTLPASLVRAALARIETGAPAVVAPAFDGGYVLIGLGPPRPELFRDIPWGGPGVLQSTRARATAAGIDLVELAAWYDVDDATGLERLSDELRGSGAVERAPATASFLLGRSGPAGGS